MVQEEKDLQKIKKLIAIMKDNDLAEIELKHGDDKILLKRSQPENSIIRTIPMVNSEMSPVAANSSAPQGAQSASASAEAVKDDNLIEINSPIVGTFYATPGPESEPYVEIGSHVEPQNIVCIVEAMKVMNEIKAEVAGTIVEIVVTTGEAVEYGQVLFKVKPD